MDKDNLKKLIESYLWRITYTNDCFRLFEHLKKSKKDYLREMNIAPAFFQLCGHSLKHTAIIELDKFYDVSGDSGLEKLLNICEQHQMLFMTSRYEDCIDADTDECIQHIEIPVNVKKDIENCRKKLDEVAEISANLRAQRDKYYAHLDKKYRDKDELLLKDFPLSYNDVSKLIDVASEICNAMLSDLSTECFLCQTTNVFDVDILLKKLKQKNN